MSLNSAAASAMPRLPVTWKEFSELLRANQAASKLPPEDRPVERITATNMDVVSYESENRGESGRFVKSDHGSWKATYERDEQPSAEARDSPEFESPEKGIDFYA
jgi:hypothetical protein